ncbi:ELP5 protein, partial [Amia calva]|nr:ELP5 protein [Amia calva]
CAHCVCCRGEQVHVLGFDVSEEELRSGLEVEAAHRLLFHDGYTDPLGWRGRDGPSASHFSAQEIGTRVGQTRDAGPVTLVVDSLSWVLRHSPPAAVCQALQELRRACCTVVNCTILHCAVILADPAANLTFNLRLSEGERQAREKLPLPFAFSSERKSALLQPRSGGGRILYEPDAADDFDQEDPDDDLDV